MNFGWEWAFQISLKFVSLENFSLEIMFYSLVSCYNTLFSPQNFFHAYVIAVCSWAWSVNPFWINFRMGLDASRKQLFLSYLSFFSALETLQTVNLNFLRRKKSLESLTQLDFQLKLREDRKSFFPWVTKFFIIKSDFKSKETKDFDCEIRLITNLLITCFVRVKPTHSLKQCNEFSFKGEKLTKWIFGPKKCLFR